MIITEVTARSMRKYAYFNKDYRCHMQDADVTLTDGEWNWRDQKERICPALLLFLEHN